jgi:CBS domain containing-hemolysin-like protein
MFELILSVGFAVIISAFCSLFEAVLYIVPASHVEALVNAGKRTGRIFKDLRSDVEKPISAILSLNTVAHTVGAAFAGSAASSVFGYQWLPYFSIVFTVLILIFSEVVPKTAGVVYGRSLVALVVYPLKALVWFMTPAIWLTGLVTRVISKGKTQEAVTAEEVRAMVRLGLRTGSIRPYQERAIDSILTLQQKTVKEVMTPRTVIFSLSQHLRVDQAVRVQTNWEHSRFPVYDRDQEDVVGIVLTKELFIALAQEKKDMRLAELMLPVRFVVETARLNRVLLQFLESRQHLFVVLDEYGGLAGIISLEDILEEILGQEIIDESDEVADKQKLAGARRTQAMDQREDDLT